MCVVVCIMQGGKGFVVEGYLQSDDFVFFYVCWKFKGLYEEVKLYCDDYKMLIDDGVYCIDLIGYFLFDDILGKFEEWVIFVWMYFVMFLSNCKLCLFEDVWILWWLLLVQIVQNICQKMWLCCWQ